MNIGKYAANMKRFSGKAGDSMDEVKRAEWQSFEASCGSCVRCGLHEGRTQVVVGRGHPFTARVMFIGEGPGEQEDLTGLAFVGRAGKLLDLALEALDFDPADLYIANIVKCRPPKNREPEEAEMTACMPWLRWQVKAIRPEVIVCLGRIAAQQIIDKGFGISKMRGQWVQKGEYPVIATWHPAAVLRDMNKKAEFLLDLKQVRRRLERIEARES